MTNEEYINQHPEQFKDDIDKWLFTEFGIIGGCCSVEKSHEYSVARMVAEKLTDTFIKKVENFLEMLGYGFTITDNITHADYDKEQLIDKGCEWLDDNLHHYWGSISADPHNFLFDFRKAMEG